MAVLTRSGLLEAPVPLPPAAWWEYAEAYTEQVGPLRATSDRTTRYTLSVSGGRAWVKQTGGADPAPGPIEQGQGWIRLGPWTGEDVLPLPLQAGSEGAASAEGAAVWRVEAEESVQVPAGTFWTLRCALRTPRSESVLWIAPGVGVVREVQGAPGKAPEIERLLERWSGPLNRGAPAARARP